MVVRQWQGNQLGSLWWGVSWVLGSKDNKNWSLYLEYFWRWHQDDLLILEIGVIEWGKSWQSGGSVLTNVSWSWLYKMSTSWSWETRRVCFQRIANLWHAPKSTMVCQIQKLGKVTEIHCAIFNWNLDQPSVIHWPLCWADFFTNIPTQPHWTAQLLWSGYFCWCYLWW